MEHGLEPVTEVVSGGGGGRDEGTIVNSYQVPQNNV